MCVTSFRLPIASSRMRACSADALTLDRFGERTTYQPSAMDDPVFYLRRVGGGAVHVWRTFRTRAEAVTYLSEAYGADSEAASSTGSSDTSPLSETWSVHLDPSQ